MVEFQLNVQWLSSGLATEPPVFTPVNIPPPLTRAAFLVKRQFAILGLPARLKSPPPDPSKPEPSAFPAVMVKPSAPMRPPGPPQGTARRKDPSAPNTA